MNTPDFMLAGRHNMIAFIRFAYRDPYKRAMSLFNLGCRGMALR